MPPVPGSRRCAAAAVSSGLSPRRSSDHTSLALLPPCRGRRLATRRPPHRTRRLGSTCAARQCRGAVTAADSAHSAVRARCAGDFCGRMECGHRGEQSTYSQRVRKTRCFRWFSPCTPPRTARSVTAGVASLAPTRCVRATWTPSKFGGDADTWRSRGDREGAVGLAPLLLHATLCSGPCSCSSSLLHRAFFRK